MNFLIIQEYSRHKNNELYRECLCFERTLKALGHQATCWGLGHKNFKEKINFNEFDVIFCLENYGDEWIPDLTPFKKPFKIFYAIDPHVRGIEPYEKIVKDKGFNFKFVALRDFSTTKNSAWLPPGVDDTLFKNLNLTRDIPIGFVGNIVTNERAEVLEYVKSKTGMQIFNMVIGDEMVNLLNRFKISFNKNISPIGLNYRNFESIACGSLLITSQNAELFDLGFEHGKNCLVYDTPQDVLSFFPVKHDLYSSIIKNGLELSKKHTYTTRCKKIIDFLKDKV